MTATYATVNGQILSENRGGTEKYYRPDTLGSVIAVTDSSGTVLSTRRYWPYGEIRVTTGSTKALAFGYVGTLGYFTDSSNSIYVRARYYRPMWGRWMTVDPLWPSEHPYVYVSGAPTYVPDPSGLQGEGILPFPGPQWLPALAALLALFAELLGLILIILAILAILICLWLATCLILIGFVHPVCDSCGTCGWRGDTCASTLRKVACLLLCIFLRTVTHYLCPNFSGSPADHPGQIRNKINSLLNCLPVLAWKCGLKYIRDIENFLRRIGIL